MAKFGGLPWDVILGAETSLAYKPLPQAYLGAAAHLNLKPSEVMLVAAHNGDLAAAAKAGLRTAFVLRPSEYGPSQTDRRQGRARLGHRHGQLHRCRRGVRGIVGAVRKMESDASSDADS